MTDTVADMYGTYNEDGTVTEPLNSILTGQPISADGSIREAIPDSPHFYRYEGAYAHQVTDELREYWQSHGSPAPKHTTRGRSADVTE